MNYMGGSGRPPSPPRSGPGVNPGPPRVPEQPRFASRPLSIDVLRTADGAVPARLAGATALVIDVLRASTTIVTALGNGAACVMPIEHVDDARACKTALGPDAILAGERDGDPPDGFDLGNSPLEFTPARVRGRSIILTTSNGTRALVAAREAAAVPPINYKLEVAFLAMARPLLPQQLSKIGELSYRRVIVQPHLLFYGELVEMVERQVVEAAVCHPQTDWMVAPPLVDRAGIVTRTTDLIQKVITDRCFEAGIRVVAPR